MRIQHLKFPVIAITKDNIIHIAKKEEDLIICSKVAFKNGFFDKLKIYDSEGIEYIVLKAEKIDTVGPFFGYNIFLNQKIKVHLLLSNETKNVDLDFLRQKVLYALSKNKDFWNSDGRYQERLNGINSAESVKVLIKEFCILW